MTGKKLISICLCLCLAFSMLAVPASALDLPLDVITAARDAVASGDEPPEETQAAVDNSEEGDAAPAVSEEAYPAVVAVEYVNPLYEDVTERTETGSEGYAPVLLADGTVPEPEYVFAEDETDALAQYMRDQFNARADSIVVGFTSDDYTMEEAQTAGTGAELLSHQLWELMEAHTGVATEGDSIRWQYGSWAMKCWIYDRGDYIEYVFSYTSIVYYTTLSQEQELSDEIASLKVSLGLMEEGKSDYEKLCAIYDHITANVAYDYAHLTDTGYKLKYTAYGALLKGLAVCQGYALALYRLALECGIDCRLIPGYGNGEAHGWNIVRLGNRYYYLDATWDAGASEYDYFLKGSDNFTDHLPDENLGTEEILAEYPISETDFDPELVRTDVDIDGDEVLTAMDIVRLMKLVIGGESADAAVDADLNRDGAVDILDVLRLLRICAVVV